MSTSRSQAWLLVLLIAAVGVAAIDAGAAGGAASEWVHHGPNGKLAYKKTPAGDTIMDFSHAGYMVYLAQLAERLGPQAVKNIGY
jgi:hypothetical protein